MNKIRLFALFVGRVPIAQLLKGGSQIANDNIIFGIFPIIRQPIRRS